MCKWKNFKNDQSVEVRKLSADMTGQEKIHYCKDLVSFFPFFFYSVSKTFANPQNFTRAERESIYPHCVLCTESQEKRPTSGAVFFS